MTDLEVLQAAVKQMYADVDRFPVGDQGRRFRAAVAPWLEGHAKNLASGNGSYSACDSVADTDAAIAIARAYLSEDEATALVVHGVFGGHHEWRDGVHTFIAPCGVIAPHLLTGTYTDITCSGCLEALS